MRTKIIIAIPLVVAFTFVIFGLAGGGHRFAQAAEQQARESLDINKNANEAIRIDLAKDLKKKQDELDRREELLNSREGHLHVVEQEIDKKIEELKRVQQKLEELVKFRDDLEIKNLANLTKAYSVMAPAEAAQRLKAMDRAIALKILTALKPKISSKILASLDAPTAAQLTEQLAKRPME